MRFVGREDTAATRAPPCDSLTGAVAVMKFGMECVNANGSTVRVRSKTCAYGLGLYLRVVHRNSGAPQLEQFGAWIEKSAWSGLTLLGA